MIRPGDEIPVLLYREPVDFRKAIKESLKKRPQA